MFTFLIIFAIFLIILNVTIRKNDSKQNKCEEDFWEQERQANFARRKDISNLQYLTTQPSHTSRGNSCQSLQL